MWNFRIEDAEPITYNSAYVEIAGSVEGGILLSYLNKRCLHETEPIEITDAELLKALCFTKYKLQREKSRLKKFSFLKIAVIGLPPKTTYLFDWSLFHEAYMEIYKKAHQQ